MKRVSKDKNRVTITKYEVRQIDKDGETVDVLDHQDKKNDAIEAAKYYLGDDVIAVVVEKVVTRYPIHLHGDPVTWDIVFTIGNEDALRAGDWI